MIIQCACCPKRGQLGNSIMKVGILHLCKDCAQIMNDRIKLAEAMDIDPNLFGPLWGNPIFDPFKDANHDYAVLEWMRDNRDIRDVNDMLDYWGALYTIGDYAKAALKVMQ